MRERPERRAAVAIADFRRASTDRRLLLQYQLGGDPTARDALVERYLPLAYQLARRHANPREPLEDLMQVAVVGLIKAIDRFDPERAVAFSTYAVPTIQGELKHHLRDVSWAIRVPAGLQELAVEIDRTIEIMQREFGRPPTVAEVAERCATSVARVSEALRINQTRQIVSLDAVRSGRTEDERTQADSLDFEEKGFELIVNMLALEPAIRALSRQQRSILRLRFVDDLSQQEIADRLQISQMHVSRLLRRSLSRLHAVADNAWE